ncbi:hypothetical protein K443DRAFT_678825, partial [Laccaria amethystina LaAM-08-1]
ITFPVARPTSIINSRAGSKGIIKCNPLSVALKKSAMFDVISSSTTTTMSISSVNSESNAHHPREDPKRNKKERDALVKQREKNSRHGTLEKQ